MDKKSISIRLQKIINPKLMRTTLVVANAVSRFFS